MVLFLLMSVLFVAALNVITCPIPYTAARARLAADSPLPTPTLQLIEVFESPLPAPQLTTPTGWTLATLPRQVPEPRHGKEKTGALPIGMLYWRWLIFER